MFHLKKPFKVSYAYITIESTWKVGYYWDFIYKYFDYGPRRDWCGPLKEPNTIKTNGKVQFKDIGYYKKHGYKSWAETYRKS